MFVIGALIVNPSRGLCPSPIRFDIVVHPSPHLLLASSLCDKRHISAFNAAIQLAFGVHDITSHLDWLSLFSSSSLHYSPVAALVRLPLLYKVFVLTNFRVLRPSSFCKQHTAACFNLFL